MLATNLSPCLRAASIRLMWPACRLPMVGTNTTRWPSACQRATCSRTAAIVVTVAMPARRGSGMEFMFGRGVGLLFDRVHETLQRVEVRVRALHEIPHEARLAARGDVEHVVQHEDLPVGIRT